MRIFISVYGLDIGSSSIEEKKKEYGGGPFESYGKTV